MYMDYLILIICSYNIYIYIYIYIYYNFFESRLYSKKKETFIHVNAKCKLFKKQITKIFYP